MGSGKTYLRAWILLEDRLSVSQIMAGGMSSRQLEQNLGLEE